MIKKLKFISIMLILILVISGCGNDKSDDVLKVGMDLKFYPFTGMNDNGEPSGVEVDIANELGKYIGKKVKIVNTEFSMLIPALQSGDIDIIIGSMLITDEREKTVNFTNPYLYNKIISILNKNYAINNGITDETSIETFFSIKDAKFIGIPGSIAVSIPQSYGYDITTVTTQAAAEREIANGTADILVGSYTLFGMHATNPNTTVIYKNPIESSGTGMAVREGNNELLKSANEFISQMESSGFNDRLRTSWDTAIGQKLNDENITLDYYLSED